MRGIREKNGTIQILLKREGMPAEPERSSEPLLQLHQDTPDLVSDYLKFCVNREIKQRPLSVTISR